MTLKRRHSNLRIEKKQQHAEIVCHQHKQLMAMAIYIRSVYIVYGSVGGLY